jgi:uncharacterized cupredoxin-like copper-binding protein
MNLKTLVPITALAATAVLVAGCGGSTRTVTTTVTAPGTTTAATSTTPSGPPLKNVAMTMTDFKFTPDTVTAAAGDVTFKQTNAGGIEHEFVLLKTDAAADSFPVKNGRMDEDTAGKAMGEVEVKPGKTKTLVIKDLKPGKYVFVCNLAGHYAGGMYGSMTVQ